MLISRKNFILLFALCTAASFSSLTIAQIQVRDLTALSDDTVLEKLGPRFSKPVSPSADVLPAVRQAIALARQTADPRYMGQAQALLGSQWGNPQASHEIMVLQATIEQSRHEFANARKTLQNALKKPAASQAQAWLTLATIERVQAQYAASEIACKSIVDPAAQTYARACVLETLSLLGQWDVARQGFETLMREVRGVGESTQQAWFMSLMAENESRAGNSAAARQWFSRSLALDNDGYTALAFADALLSSQQAAQAVAILQTQPDSDAVLIRRAQAYKQLKDPRFVAIAGQLEQRMAVSAQRSAPGDTGHAREQALYALHVQGDAKAALAFAQINLQLQREPIDWLIALQSAQHTGNVTEKASLIQAAAKTGLKDMRLQ
jgi:hypothetical protein